jgi:hypothetical protein
LKIKGEQHYEDCSLLLLDTVIYSRPLDFMVKAGGLACTYHSTPSGSAPACGRPTDVHVRIYEVVIW